MSKNYSSGANRKDSGKSFNKPKRKTFTKGVNTGSEETSKKSDYKAKRSFSKNKDFRGNQNKMPFDKKFTENKFERGEKKQHGRPFERSYSKPSSDKKFGSKSFDNKPFKKSDDGNFNSREKSFSRNKEEGFKKDYSEKKSYQKRDDSDFKSKEKSFSRNKNEGFKKDYSDKKPFKKHEDYGFKNKEKAFDKPYKKSFDDKFSKPRSKSDNDGYKKKEFNDDKKRVKFDEFESGKSFTQHKRNFDSDKPRSKKTGKESNDGLIRLNKYLSNSGIASRRDADTLIAGGTVKVNGVPVTEMGYKIKPTDVVTYGDAKVRSERKVYLLLNKPKDYITTMDDPQERKTVMQLISNACKERIYPVGRLDRNTTGLLLFTNDGALATKLTHPKNNIKKVYHVSLNKGLRSDDFASIIEGVELEDGFVKADDLAFVGEGKKEIGIEVHSGRNRIVRRIFEHLGYEVIKLDRVTFAGLTKKDLPRGKHRFLTGKEISFLQMIGV